MKISTASKKVLASALSAAMVVAFAPAAAFAAAGTTEPIAKDQIATVKVYEGANNTLTTYYPTSLADLNELIADGTGLTPSTGDKTGIVVDLISDIAGTIEVSVDQKVTVNGNGKSVEGITVADTATEKVAISNVKITASTTAATKEITSEGADVTISDVEIADYDKTAGKIGDIEATAGKLTLSNVKAAALDTTDTDIVLSDGDEIDAITVTEADTTANKVVIGGGSYKTVALTPVDTKEKDSIIINGGTFAGGIEGTTPTPAVQIAANVESVDGGITINGGTFKAQVSGQANEKVVIKGGTFDGYVTYADMTKVDSVSKFAIDPTVASYNNDIDTNAAATKGEDGYYTIGLGASTVTLTATALKVTAAQEKANTSAANTAAKKIVTNLAAGDTTGLKLKAGTTAAALKAASTGNTAEAMTFTFDDDKNFTYTQAVKDAGANQTDLYAQKTAAEAIQAKIADSTVLGTPQQYYVPTAKLTTAISNLEAEILELGQAVTYTYQVAYSSANSYKVLCYKDGAVSEVEATFTPAAGAAPTTQNVTFAVSSFGGVYAVVATSTKLDNTKSELEKAQAEAEQAKKDLEAAQAELATAKKAVSMTTYKTFKASTVKKAAQYVTVAKGAKVSKVKTSSSKITVKSNKIKVAKGTKKGTYTAKVKVTPSGQATSTVTVTIVVK